VSLFGVCNMWVRFGCEDKCHSLSSRAGDSRTLNETQTRLDTLKVGDVIRGVGTLSAIEPGW